MVLPYGISLPYYDVTLRWIILHICLIVLLPSHDDTLMMALLIPCLTVLFDLYLYVSVTL